MARPPFGLGKHGSIRVTSEGGQWVARCRFRQPNGQTVRVERWASSKTAATNNLQDELRNRAGERTAMLSASSRFADAAEILIGPKAADYMDFAGAPHFRSPADVHLRTDGSIDLLREIVEVRYPEQQAIFDDYARMVAGGGAHPQRHPGRDVNHAVPAVGCGQWVWIDASRVVAGCLLAAAL